VFLKQNNTCGKGNHLFQAKLNLRKWDIVQAFSQLVAACICEIRSSQWHNRNFYAVTHGV
jgi:hypothetical protein